MSMHHSIVGFAPRLAIPAVLAMVFAFSLVATAAVVSGVSTTASSAQVTFTQLTLARPSVQSGDLMIANIVVNGGSQATTTAPQGWSLIARTDNDTAVSVLSYWKKVTADPEPANYTWTIDKQTTATGGITPYTGIDTDNPIDAVAVNTGFGTQISTSALNATQPYDQLITIFATDVGKSTSAGNYFSQPTGMTEKYDVTNAPYGPSTAFDEKTISTIGLVPVATSSIAGNKPHYWVSQHIALRTAAAGTDCGTQPECNVVTSGTNRALVALVVGDTVDGSVACTYAGTPMTLVDKSSTPNERWIYGFLLLNPNIGSNLLSCNGGAIRVVAASYNGIAQIGQPDSFANTNGAAVSSLSSPLTLSSNGEMVVQMTYAQQGNATSASINQSPMNVRVAGPGGYSIWDSAGVTAGLKTVSFVNSQETNLSQIVFALITAN